MKLNNASTMYLADQLAAQVSSPSAGVVRQEMSRRVRVAMEQLRPNDREVLELLYLEELDPGEVADILEIRRSAVRNRHMRAIQRLTKLLKKGENQ